MKTEEIVNEIRNQDAGAAWITTPLNVFYFSGYLSDPHERLLALLIT
ncbi:aminopeptidase P family N-terminal domain-containing protein, partial [Streptococcus porcinus]